MPQAIKTKLRSRNRDDRGAALVEAAFAMPLFFLIVFGIFEFSGMVLAKSTTSDIISNGTRAASISGNGAMGDQMILKNMSQSATGISGDTINRVIIWKAGTIDEKPPEACLNSPASLEDENCNVYISPDAPDGAFEKATLPNTQTGAEPVPTEANYWFGCTTGYTANKLDCGWYPQSRRVLERAPGVNCYVTPEKCESTDMIGIYIDVTHKHYTALFGTETQNTEYQVTKIEPSRYDR